MPTDPSTIARGLTEDSEPPFCSDLDEDCPGVPDHDGMTAEVDHGDGAFSSIINPQSFIDGGPEWVMRYGDPESIRFSVASLLSSYDYLLSDNINLREAIKRLMLMRRARAALVRDYLRRNER